METTRNNGSRVAGSMLILFGLLALLGQFFRGFIEWRSFWPILIIGCGLLLFVGMVATGKSAAGLAVPGSIITSTGLILLVQNLTGYWESWSYVWTVIVIAVGLGVFIMGAYNGNEDSRRSGLRIMQVGFILMILFGVLFELILNLGGYFRGDLGRFGLPVVLIGVGVMLLLGRFINQPAPKAEMQTPAVAVAVSSSNPTDSDRQARAER